MGRGVCIEDGSCNCDAGFFGRTCGISCAVGLAGMQCSGRGICDERGLCVCKSGMAGLISGYEGDACQKIVYNRTGMRAFSTTVSPETPDTANKWMALVAPVVIAAFYVIFALKRAKKENVVGRP
jgi:hypothetical protein